MALHVIIDPGHGGSDKGAHRQGLYESEIVLDIANQLTQRLKDDSRIQVSQTRTKNENMSLEERTRFAMAQHGDIFVSIHVNSSPILKAHGAEIYFQNQLAADQESLYLAARENEEVNAKNGTGELDDLGSIIYDLHKQHQIWTSFDIAKSIYKFWSQNQQKVHIRQAPFHVLAEVEIPSVLVEVGFISNPEEFQWLKKPNTHREIAESLYVSLTDFLKTWKKNRN